MRQAESAPTMRLIKGPSARAAKRLGPSGSAGDRAGGWGGLAKTPSGRAPADIHPNGQGGAVAAKTERRIWLQQ